MACVTERGEGGLAKTIWYISKYVTPRYAARAGARGFLILRELVKSGHRAVLICSDANHLATPPEFGQPVLREVADGVEVHWVRTRKYKSANSLGRILSWIDFEWRLWRMPKARLPRPDAIIVSSLSLLTILNGLWLRRKYRATLVFEVRDIWPLSLQEHRGWRKWNPIVVMLGRVEWLGYRYADVVVGTMPNLGAHVTEVLGYEREVACVPQGVDDAMLAPAAPLAQAFVQDFMPTDKFTVVYAGSIGVANALDILFEVAEALKAHENLHFLVLGEGYLKAQYQQKYGHLSNLTFAPGVPKNMVQSVLAFGDLMFLSVPKSRLLDYGQSLNKLIDYMLSGKPVLASYSGYPSMLNQAGCGSFAPAGDANALKAEILRYAAMPEKDRLAMGAAGRDWVLEHRRFSALADHYLSLLDTQEAS